MKGEILLQNVFYLFVLAIILEASVMAIFSVSILKNISERIPVETARDFLIIILAFVLCYKVNILTLFSKTGIRVPKMMDTVISALVLARMTFIIRDFMAKIKLKD